jgi:hypothetical protein
VPATRVVRKGKQVIGRTKIAADGAKSPIPAVAHS